MIHLAIFAALAACLCFGAVLMGQIRRIDSIENKQKELRHLDVKVKVFNAIQEMQNSDVAKLHKRLQQLERATERVTACSVAEFSPGDVHPFAPDAFVSTTDVFA